MSALFHLLGGATSGSQIQSVQQVVITIGNGATSNTASITSVNTANAFILYNGFTTTYTGTDQSRVLPRVELTNGTTVTAYRNTADTATITLRATVVEFKSTAIQSIQQGTITLGTADTAQTATISSITTTNAAVFFLGQTTDYTLSSSAVSMARLDITNATTVTVNRNSTGTASVTVGYVVVEFKSGILNSGTQQRAVTLTSANTSDTDTITSVTTGRAMLAYGGRQTGSAGVNNSEYNLQLTNGTTVTLARTTTSTTTRTINYTVIEFASGILNSVQRGTTAISSATSADTAITSVTLSKAALNMLGFSTDASAWAERACTVKLSNATTVRGEKDTAGTTTATPGWEVIEFV